MLQVLLHSIPMLQRVSKCFKCSAANLKTLHLLVRIFVELSIGVFNWKARPVESLSWLWNLVSRGFTQSLNVTLLHGPENPNWEKEDEEHLGSKRLQVLCTICVAHEAGAMQLPLWIQNRSPPSNRRSQMRCYIEFGTDGLYLLI